MRRYLRQRRRLPGQSRLSLDWPRRMHESAVQHRQVHRWRQHDHQRRVYDPQGANPLYNVVVYIPNQPLAPIASGVSCETCAAPVSAQPVASALTDATGHFVMETAPCRREDDPDRGADRQVAAPDAGGVGHPCEDNPIADTTLRLPATSPRATCRRSRSRPATRTRSTASCARSNRRFGVHAGFRHGPGKHVRWGRWQLEDRARIPGVDGDVQTRTVALRDYQARGLRLLILQCEGSQLATKRSRTWPTSGDTPTTADASSTSTCTHTGSERVAALADDRCVAAVNRQQTAVTHADIR